MVQVERSAQLLTCSQHPGNVSFKSLLQSPLPLSKISTPFKAKQILPLLNPFLPFKLPKHDV